MTGNWLGGHINYRRGHRKGHRNVMRTKIIDKITNAIMISGMANLSTDVDASLPSQPTTATSSHMSMSTVHKPIPPAHVIPSMLPVPTAVACRDHLGRPDEPDTVGPHDGGVRVCNNEAKLYD